MGAKVWNSQGGGIIWEGDGVTAYRKRGSEVLRSVQRYPGSYGFVGSDRIAEDGFGGNVEILERVKNTGGQLLRFALIARDGNQARELLSQGESFRAVTSYPGLARQIFGERMLTEYVTGGVEVEMIDRSIDLGFELVQSGDSLRDAGLEIVEDDIVSVWLAKISTGGVV